MHADPYCPSFFSLFHLIIIDIPDAFSLLLSLFFPFNRFQFPSRCWRFSFIPKFLLPVPARRLGIIWGGRWCIMLCVSGPLCSLRCPFPPLLAHPSQCPCPRDPVVVPCCLCCFSRVPSMFDKLTVHPQVYRQTDTELYQQMMIQCVRNQVLCQFSVTLFSIR